MNKIQVCPPKPGVKGEICFGPVCFTWADPLCGFKPQQRGWRKPTFPCVMCGGNWGRQLVYEKESELTYFQDQGPIWWHYPAIGKYAFAGAEEICEGFEDRRVRSAAIKYNIMVGNGLVPGGPIVIPASTVHLNDIYIDDESDAFTRSAALANIGPQPDPVTVATIFQANDEKSFNEYLTQFRQDGWLGAWVRPNESLWTDVEYFVDEEL